MKFPAYHDIYPHDPYFRKEYIHCYLEEGDEVFEFRLEDGQDFFCFRSIKRPIRVVGKEEIDEDLYDLESVYGYGGYITNSSSVAFVKWAMQELKAKCLEEKIIAHFMRFHPLNKFPLIFKDILSFKAVNRKVVFVDVQGRSYEEVRSGYSSSLKRNINKAHRAGLEVRRLEPSSLVMESFVELYHSTMKRKDAAEMYFFSTGYFQKLFRLEQLSIYGTFLEDELISMILTLDSGQGEVYYHLGATHADYYSYNPNPFIMDQLVQRIQRRGGRFLFLGGGNSFSDDDPLFRFKKKFSKEQHDFYIGGSVIQPEKFQELKALAKGQNPNLPPLFLSYRFV